MGCFKGVRGARRIKSPQHALLLNWKEKVRQWSSPGWEDPGVCGRLTPGGGSGRWQPREHPLVTGLGAVAQWPGKGQAVTTQREQPQRESERADLGQQLFRASSPRPGCLVGLTYQ